MTLEEKGPISPPPQFALPIQTVSNALQTWGGLTAAAHWDLYDTALVDGADFYVGQEELGHIHLNGDVHLATINELRKPLVEAGLAQRFPFGGEYEGWVLYHIQSAETARHAIWLFHLNYLRLTGTPLADIINLISNHKHEIR